MKIKVFGKREVFLLWIIAFLLLSVLLQNRSFFFGYCVASAGLFMACFGRLTRGRVIILILVLVSLLVVLVTFLKVDSSSGRMLIYKLSFNVLSENFPVGVGAGRFGNELALAQIAYFEQGGFTVKELLLADNVVHAYNDYLEFLVEYGTWAIVMVFVGASFMFWLLARIIKINRSPSMPLLLCLLQIFAMLIAANFTFVFYRLFFQLLFLSCLIVLFHYAKVGRKITVFSAALFFGALLWSHWGRVEGYRFRREIVQAQVYSRGGYFQEAVEICESIKPALSNNNEFLWVYANCLLELGDVGKAIVYTKRLLQLNNNHLVYGLLGRCYQKAGHYVAANRELVNAVNKVPNRVQSRYELFLFLVSQKDWKKASLEKERILRLPIKVSSKTVDELKRLVRETPLAN